MTLTKAISYMDRFGGGNFRIERKIRSEGWRYKRLKRYDTNRDSAISVSEYMEGISRENPRLARPTAKERKIANYIDVLRNGLSHERDDAASSLDDKRALPALIKALHDPFIDVRFWAAHSLGRIGDVRAIPALVKTLFNPSSAYRAAAEALGEIGHKSAIPSLIKALLQKSLPWRARVHAAIALGTIGHPSAVWALALALKGPPSPKFGAHIQGAAIQALEEIKHRTTVPPLIRAMRHPYTGVRNEVARILRKKGDKRAIPVLIKALRDNFAKVRIHAAFALGDMKARQAIPALTRLLRDPNGGVRKAAHAAIWRINNK